MRELQGIPLADGVAIGRAVCLHDKTLKVFRFPLAEDQVEQEVERFRQALDATRHTLRETAARVEGELSEELGAIFDAHQLILGDAAFVDRVERRIRERLVNADWAVYRTIQDFAERFLASDSESLKDRVDDLRDVGRSLVRSLQGIHHHSVSELAGDVVLVAADLTPSEAVHLGREGALAFVVEGGGRTSHTTIIARALNIPMVGGVHGVTEQATDNDPLVVDGTEGRVILHPGPEILERYRRERQAADEARRAAVLVAPAAITDDGEEIRLLANIDLEEELQEARRLGAQGIGLYRSEFLYIERSPELPTEEDHLATYRGLVDAMSPHPVVVRTYDLGGRKIAREVMETSGDNPALGLRGVRLTLERPDIFRSQVRALYRAGAEGDLRVMLPMVSSLEEVRRFRRLSDEVCAELRSEGLVHRADLPLGAMVEVPAAAMITDHLAREVDFLSIGTNDLAQYTLAVDRNNEQVSELYDVLHPGLLRMLRFVMESAREAGIEVSICGEMAADPAHLPLLLGLGLRRLSVGPRGLPRLRQAIGELAAAGCGELVDRCLEAATGADVREILASRERQREPVAAAE
ncbi:MAG: phosphoenolpyruvate--protein phosphotransferase [Thermoanaerobaculia bacterium]